MSLCFVGPGRPLSNGERSERGVQLGVASEEAHKIAIVQVRVLHHGRWGTTSISDYLSHLPLGRIEHEPIDTAGTFVGASITAQSQSG